MTAEKHGPLSIHPLYGSHDIQRPNPKALIGDKDDSGIGLPMYGKCVRVDSGVDIR
jgi:hypothetical protein